MLIFIFERKDNFNDSSFFRFFFFLSDDKDRVSVPQSWSKRQRSPPPPPGAPPGVGRQALSAPLHRGSGEAEGADPQQPKDAK